MKRNTSKTRRTDRGQAYLITGTLILLVIGGMLIMSYEQVEEGHIGVERVFGDVTGETYDPGPHIKPPWIGVQNIETRPRTYTMSDTSGEGERSEQQDAIQVQSVNGTTHRVDVTIRYRIEGDQADEFVTQWQTVDQAETRLIRPTVRSQMRDEAAAIGTSIIYRAEGRTRLAESAHAALEQEFQGEALVLEAVQVRGVSIPADYQEELNRREVSKAEITRRQHEVEVERQEARRKEIEAQANADVIRIEGEAIRQNPEILQLRYIEAIRNNDKIIIGGGSGTPIILDGTGNGSGASPAAQNQTANTTASEVLGG